MSAATLSYSRQKARCVCRWRCWSSTFSTMGLAVTSRRPPLISRGDETITFERPRETRGGTDAEQETMTVSRADLTWPNLVVSPADQRATATQTIESEGQSSWRSLGDTDLISYSTPRFRKAWY